MYMLAGGFSGCAKTGAAETTVRIAKGRAHLIRSLLDNDTWCETGRHSGRTRIPTSQISASAQTSVARGLVRLAAGAEILRQPSSSRPLGPRFAKRIRLQ